jgi:2-oxoglutarate ferredoxin oxidoreductase subunit alpha
MELALNENKKNYLRRLEGHTYFLQGDEACAFGAIYAGCDFFAGYPITPASEIAEKMAEELPKAGGFCVQMEDELASMGAVIGASWTGARAMTATSGPGFSLMQENIDIIAMAPSSVQECFDLVIDCFNFADTYRTPVIFLMDGEIGHIRESVTMPLLSSVKRAERRPAGPGDQVFGGPEFVPAISHYGEGRFVHVTGSTHKANGMRDVTTQSVHDLLVRRIYGKIEEDREKIVRIEADLCENGRSRVGVISFGASARPSLGAVKKARAGGIDVDFMRLVTIWPFAGKRVGEFSKNLDAILVPEMNLGQVSREIERFVDCDVIPVSKIGGVPHTVDEIHSAIMKVV